MDYLIVDDSITMQSLLGNKLEELSGDLAPDEVSVRSNGADALDFIHDYQGAGLIVLLDINMPGDTDGVKALELIRGMDTHYPVVMVTGDTEKEAEAMQAGATYFLKKPFSNDNFATAIDAAYAEITPKAE